MVDAQDCKARVGLFGGSFDPIHKGHVEPILEACRQLRLDHVWYLPTARPPHKQGRKFADSHRRLAMVELALLDHEQLKVDALELDDRDVHYTVETVRVYRKRMPNARLFLFLGADSLLEFDQWKSWQEIAAECDLVALRRPGYDLRLAEWPDPLRQELDSSRVHRIDNHAWNVSSTRLREQLEVAAGGELAAGAVADSLEPRVLQYIEKYGLYRSA